MKLERTGIILYTIEYEKCIQFYEKTIGLKKMFAEKNLTCFEFGGSYLMVEIDDEYEEHQNKSGRIKTCLRMNIQNVRDLADKLIASGVEVDYQEHTWGTVAKFYDPDGNLCAFKDSEKFEKQIADFKSDHRG